MCWQPFRAASNFRSISPLFASCRERPAARHAAQSSLPPAVRERVRALRDQGFEVSVARRVVYLFDLDLSRGGNGSQTPPEEREMLLRPDGSDAKRPPR